MTQDEFMTIHQRHRQICKAIGEPMYLVDVIDQLEQEFETEKVKEYLKMLRDMEIK